ncbi:glycoside hydrolase [Echinicola jeungdonensis]|uniref:Glycoside hydrolase n=1 Tax=Echinicola jeungdonensis TaxID=709343 RepID=A0ABV5J9D9_9BACT|nr:glycoside hydrolase [Echinicola jeungdonensis]MDN3670457.1 glycoside hydrolase [Echinicola jeungdonensis]
MNYIRKFIGILSYLILGCLIINACQPKNKIGATSSNRGNPIVHINAIQQRTYQTIEHFGASDAWSCQFVGLWPEQKKFAIAELLFSQEMDGKGNPKGIGLSLWRFNIGAGSAEQGTQSGIGDEWRRAESFMNADGSYDWSKQAGQVWFAQKAKEMGVENLLVFPNSPPVHMTKTGKAFGQSGNSNLDQANYDDFGNYLANVIEGLEAKGLDVDYISPVNEPQWDWSDGGQEGTPFWNDEIVGIVRELDKALEEKGLEAKIDIAEAGQLNYLYEQGNKQGRGNQVEGFFSKGSPNYLGDLKHMGNAISGHSYFTTSPFNEAVKTREKVAESIMPYSGLKFWMSEYCILGDNAGEINGNGRDLGIDPALYMARVIHNDLTVANASAWHWWLGVSPYDYKDGLVYIDYQKEDGNFYESKMLWALGNYSRFIRPGFQRIAVNIMEETRETPGLLVSAYLGPGSHKIIYVLVNSGIKSKEVSLELNGKEIQNKKVYITSKDYDLTPMKSNDKGLIEIPSRSIVTVVSEDIIR